MRKAIFLDRDGTICRAIVREGRPHAPTTLDEFAVLPEAPAQLRRLREAGFLLIVVTNQPDVARGLVSRATVEEMHRLLQAALLIDDIKICYETETQSPNRYKPKPGMLLEAAEENAITLESSYMIGDRWRDVGAGRAAGCFTIFIDHKYLERQPDRPDAVVQSLSEAVDLVLRNSLGEPR